ncbi:hypothetical protein [Vreelandella aquamarina]|uniref:hypothetical protein n=1 Tax=Vreelandella aquamarina TaxID=77097 RepID=UPI0014289DE0|nr:hypothetical protein [Halomonas aquamarina]
MSAELEVGGCLWRGGWAAGAAFAPGRRCGRLLRSLLSLSRYAALRGIALCGFIIAS